MTMEDMGKQVGQDPQDPPGHRDQPARLVLPGRPDRLDSPEQADEAGEPDVIAEDPAAAELIGAIHELAEYVKTLSDQVSAERVDRRRSIRRVAVLGGIGVVLVAVGFTVGLLLAYNRIDGRVDVNSQGIRTLFFEQCSARRTDVIRQNGLIDSAIEAEKRKPNPDPKRVRDLENFKSGVPVCGQKP